MPALWAALPQNCDGSPRSSRAPFARQRYMRRAHTASAEACLPAKGQLESFRRWTVTPPASKLCPGCYPTTPRNYEQPGQSVGASLRTRPARRWSGAVGSGHLPSNGAGGLGSRCCSIPGRPSGSAAFRRFPSDTPRSEVAGARIVEGSNAHAQVGGELADVEQRFQSRGCVRRPRRTGARCSPPRTGSNRRDGTAV